MVTMETETSEWTMAYLAALSGATGREDFNASEAVERAELIADATVALLAARKAARYVADRAKRNATIEKVLAQRTYTWPGGDGGERKTGTVANVEGVCVVFSDGTKVCLADMDDCGFEPVLVAKDG